MNTKKLIKWVVIAIAMTALFILFVIFDPSQTPYFPKCPFLQITGYKCPGCGSQRAIHSLLNFDFYRAMHENFLLVLSIPYVLVGAVFDLIKEPSEKVLRWRNRFFGIRAIYTVLIIVIVYWITRNIFSF